MKKCTCLYKAGCGRAPGLLSGTRAGRRRCSSAAAPPAPVNFFLHTPLSSCSLAPGTDRQGDQQCPCLSIGKVNLPGSGQRAARQESSAHHVVAVDPVHGVLHGVVDFPSEHGQVLRKPAKKPKVEVRGARREYQVRSSWPGAKKWHHLLDTCAPCRSGSTDMNPAPQPSTHTPTTPSSLCHS